MPDTNATLNAGSFGTVNMYVTELGYSAVMISSETQTAKKRAFYPKIRTSGGWHVKIITPSHLWYVYFQLWMKNYIDAVSNASVITPSPMTLTVPSRNFTKTGFPESSVAFKNEQGIVAWELTLEFSSASNVLDSSESSRYVAPAIGNQDVFYPAGYQSSDEVDPITTPWGETRTRVWVYDDLGSEVSGHWEFV